MNEGTTLYCMDYIFEDVKSGFILNCIQLDNVILDITELLKVNV